MINCPACERARLEPTGQTVDLPQMLGIWERVIGRPLPKAVWDEYHDRTVALARCAVCGFGRFEPVIVGSPAFYEAITETDYYVGDKWEFTTAIRDLQLEGLQRVLDYGGGSGGFLRRFRAAEPAADLSSCELVEGTQASLAAEGHALLHGDGAALLSMAASIPSFDAITCFQVLEHVEKPLELIEAFAALLRPGGVLILSTPDAGGPISNFPEALTEVPPHHVTQWTQSAFRALLPRMGFVVERVRHEPLPDYLWADYLPVQWPDVWPAAFFDIPGGCAEALKAAGARHLFGVPGHTVYVRARLVGSN